MGAPPQQPPRYWGRTISGGLVHGDQLTADTTSIVQLDGSAAGALSWIADRQMPLPERPPARVEFWGGDCLPGSVHRFQTGGATPHDQARNFIVRTTAFLAGPGDDQPAEVRVSFAHIKRIVWQHRGGRYAPGKVLLRTGESLRYRQARFREDRVEVLLADRQRIIPFSEVAEFHFPQTDPWDVYFATLGVLCSRHDTRCRQIETITGIVATTSRERGRVVPAEPPFSWDTVIMFRPAWSRDMLAVRQSEIRLQRFWSRDTVPLACFDPLRRDAGERILWDWQRNATVVGIPLSVRPRGFGSGFGVPCPARLEFALPVESVGLATAAALDHPDSPTSVQTSLLVDGEPLEERRTLGDGRVTDRFEVTWPRGAGRLGLAAAPSRGSAESLTIGGSLHWGDPHLRLDSERLEDRLRSAAGPFDGSWQGWRSPSSVSRSNVLLPGWGPHSWIAWCFSGANEGVRLQRSVEIPDDSRWLVVDAVQCDPASPAATLEVKIDGNSRGSYPLFVASNTPRHARQPVAVALDGVPRGRPATIEIHQQEDGIRICWRSIRFASRHPNFLSMADPQQTQPLSLAVGEPVRIRWPQPIAIREYPHPGQYRFLRFACRTPEAGQLRLRFIRQEAGEFEYTAGGVSSGDSSRTVIAGELTGDWIVVTRDLFADFGASDLSAVQLSAEQGVCEWQGGYLARTRGDFPGREIE